ncbi:MAG: hypothetical protein ACTSRI_14535 [Promethearchaeota archaeon]
MTNVIFIHGLESSGQGFKGQIFRKEIPGCLTPDFKEYIPGISSKILLKERMAELVPILRDKSSWNIIGSSFGGLMGAIYTFQNPIKVARLILLAPLLATPELNPKGFPPIDVPVVIYHGKRDQVVPIKPTRTRAEQLFVNLTYNVVDDDHYLHPTVQAIDWKKLIDIK